MNVARLPEWCLRIGMLYLLAGMCLGAFMGMKEDFTFKDVHAHFNLLGFTATFLMGLFLKVYPATLKSKLAVTSVLTVLVTVAVMLALLVAFYMGYTALAPALGLFSLVVIVAYVLFAISVFRVTA